MDRVLSIYPGDEDESGDEKTKRVGGKAAKQNNGEKKTNKVEKAVLVTGVKASVERRGDMPDVDVDTRVKDEAYEAEENGEGLEEEESPDLVEIRKEIKNLIVEKYNFAEIREEDISDILKDSFIHKEQSNFKEIILRLMVLEKLVQLTVKRQKKNNKAIRRVENHLETVRKGMLMLSKKIDVQTGAVSTLDGY
ncbi:M115L [Myxoma virus]|nr:m115L [Myxoma virus]AMB18447.1 m115L [Myxoma virus]WLM68569.1 M115L [Myxoma virus]WNN26996.1 M115L [Myxoma virus]